MLIGSKETNLQVLFFVQFRSVMLPRVLIG